MTVAVSFAEDVVVVVVVVVTAMMDDSDDDCFTTVGVVSDGVSGCSAGDDGISSDESVTGLLILSKASCGVGNERSINSSCILVVSTSYRTSEYHMNTRNKYPYTEDLIKVFDNHCDPCNSVLQQLYICNALRIYPKISSDHTIHILRPQQHRCPTGRKVHRCHLIHICSLCNLPAQSHHMGNGAQLFAR